ncbi:MAG: NADH dehydrogenase (quinone) subunit D [Candidatus Alcyoniella australis]|nr:NADH dehydrogenase (quinone) subunit D [Candidatus Alcyoniella australis]
MGERFHEMTLNMGPQHPSTHGVLRLVLKLEGETVLDLDPVIGYLHRGIEKIAEHKTYHQIIPLTDRLDYTAPICNSFGYALAVEKLLGTDVPARARLLRVLLNELGRIEGHLLWLGSHAMDIGAMTVFLYTFRERELTYEIFEEVAGGRLMVSWIRIGGCAYDLTPRAEEKLREFVELFPRKIDDYETLLTDNRIWHRRTKGIGVLPPEDAVAMGFTGPMLRGSGVPYDVRKTYPYSGYDDLEFEMALAGAACDTYDRYLVRIKEMRESNKIVKQCLDLLRPGPINADLPRVVPPPKAEVNHNIESLIHHFHLMTEGFDVPRGEVYQAVEAPKGELGFTIVSDSTAKPWRLKIRLPSFGNLQGLPLISKGHMIADISALVGTTDICLADVDK